MILVNVIVSYNRLEKLSECFENLKKFNWTDVILVDNNSSCDLDPLVKKYKKEINIKYYKLSENIGACARAMKNFNFSNLVIIKPKPSFPNDKIFATSVGAKEIIQKAKVYENFEDSLSNFDYLIATSSRFRNKNVKHINLEGLKKIDFRKKIGFLFGSEASGLSNNEISYANYALQIPTNPDFKSLNLSHSLIIIAQYVSSIISSKVTSFKKSNKVSINYLG